ncbi:TauD/TfdA family dioxygenase [Streptomyces sp. YIM S03343]
MNITSRSGDSITAHQLLALLDTEGIAFLSAADCDDVIRIFRRELRVFRHSDSPATPWTMISPLLNGQRTPGLSGFSRAALAPHTDRSLHNYPPSILCFLMIREASDGGDSILIDTKPILSRYDLESLHSIENDLRLSSSQFGQEHKVLTVSDRRSVVIRYRDDEVAQPQASSRQSKFLLADLDQARCSAQQFRLRPGDGYLIHNHRILHGRTAFSGFRLGARLLFFVNEDSPHAHLNDGFSFDRRHTKSKGIY